MKCRAGAIGEAGVVDAVGNANCHTRKRREATVDVVAVALLNACRHMREGRFICVLSKTKAGSGCSAPSVGMYRIVPRLCEA